MIPSQLIFIGLPYNSKGSVHKKYCHLFARPLSARVNGVAEPR